MSKLNINELFLYRHRFFIGYCLIGLGLITVLLFAGLYTPGGLSKQEMQSVVTSSAITKDSINSFSIANLPYHFLQKASLAVFGISILSIKLPSIILAFFSAIGIVLLLRRWFKPYVGVLASLIAISTGQFIFFAQDGTPSIIYIFWAVWLMLLSSLIIRKEKYKIVYIIAFYIAAALSLYTPLSIYALIALVGSIVLHPHLRFLIKSLSKIKIIIGISVAIILISPLILSIINTPKLAFDLLGIPTHWPNLIDNIILLRSEYFGFTNPGGSTLTTPFFELGSMMIVAVGIYYVIKNRVTSKNYVIILWTVCIIPIVILNPGFTSVTFLPIVLLLASGLHTLLSHWYELFPKNPYARIGGLIPLTILISVLVFSGADRYIYGYNYDPNVASSFSKDLKFVTTGAKDLVVTNEEFAFYSVVAKYNKFITVSTNPNTDIFWASKGAKKNFPGYTIDKIQTSSVAIDGDRFYLYKKSVN